MTIMASPILFEGRLFATVSEVAEVLGYDERTVRRGIKDGQIPATQVGVTHRVPTAWIRAQALVDGAA
ncbi:helix-turn-helix domain-containing protein [Streptosporangium sp. NBC_01756]|uniref:helix-turn-helix domain-containing protein n=1 Tax=Streptosporangium sp. NBC_01756 TaxID=2975950 RepID=UPI002DD9160F|nr:helix-turn-helix domain-containing protein [Streptosporangium sp. NBC_01756]WSC90063.1 helix-turn-helix domain-containing protein [Streptosporangium sp. NBC_01756]